MKQCVLAIKHQRSMLTDCIVTRQKKPCESVMKKLETRQKKEKKACTLEIDVNLIRTKRHIHTHMHRFKPFFKTQKRTDNNISFNTVRKLFVDLVVVVDHDYEMEIVHRFVSMNQPLTHHCQFLQRLLLLLLQLQELQALEQSEISK